MVRHHALHFRETNGLDADACQDLLIGEGLQQFPTYWSGGGFPETEQDDGTGEQEGDEVCNNEGELKAMIAVLYRVVAIVSRGTKKESLLARSDSFMSARNVVIEMSVV
jgi:hypothetical protein